MQLRPGRADASSMTSARAILVPPESPGTYHCVSRCVRRAWLCGTDRETGRSFEHRRQWVEDRIHELSKIFAVAIWRQEIRTPETDEARIRGPRCV